MNETLTPELLLHAYSVGVFPMGRGGKIYWYDPDPRAIFDLDTVHFSRRLLRTIRSGRFEVRFDTAFEAVIRACAERESVWITEAIIAAYTELHHWGYAHSVESWLDGNLVGGLYGVSLGGAFFGESMFFRATDASKIAFYALVERLRARHFVLLDTQFTNDHLEQFQVIEVPRRMYRQQLRSAIAQPCQFL
jgi:leucyl/phenylalanyl-tRNA---protein transferase